MRDIIAAEDIANGGRNPLRLRPYLPKLVLQNSEVAEEARSGHLLDGMAKLVVFLRYPTTACRSPELSPSTFLMARRS